MTRIALAMAFLLPVGAATAQPPGGPATELYVTNTTKQTVVVQVFRPGGVLSEAVKAGDALHGKLLNIKDDRLLVISKDSRTWTIYDSAAFNSSSSPFPTIGYAIVEKDGVIKLQVLFQGKGGLPPVGAKPKIEEKDDKKDGK